MPDAYAEHALRIRIVDPELVMPPWCRNCAAAPEEHGTPPAEISPGVQNDS
ncbi:MAG: hypothetical protein ACLSUW_03065 [Akkermansia sp.]